MTVNFALYPFALIGLFASAAHAQQDFGAQLDALHQTTDYASPGAWHYTLTGADLLEDVAGQIEGMDWQNHHHLCDFDTDAQAVERDIDLSVVEDQRHAFLFFPLRAEVKQAQADGIARAEAAFTEIVNGDENSRPDDDYRVLATRTRAGEFGPVVQRNYTEVTQDLFGERHYSFEPLFTLRLIARAENADRVIAVVDAARKAACETR
ncbi:hypothetical protein EGN72_11755 [Pseudorhodobacter sp. E13]|uniref:hypothetical protein n=1 Tax=Pseudorhodobacter sp. E13 TaxID=2487931 RepID=UPI000F8E3A7C|nr:hypothetical protein [Pseudorhodobacter sp. E13]RUS59958.1 hypothetical protein EGN72_11755 [Pseudorhodobacter sp. E13]